MRRVEVVARVPGRTAEAVYAQLGDFERYPRYTPQVRSVSTRRLDAHRSLSSWEVLFQRGILRWVEEDCFEPEHRTIRFHQTEGDVEHFTGEWSVRDEEDGCVIRFAGELELGLPTLSDLLEPIAEKALQENIEAIITGLVAGPHQFLKP